MTVLVPTVRLSQPTDREPLISWFMEGDTLDGFPMQELPEVTDAVKLWMDFVAYLRCGITAEVNGEPCGMAVLYLQYLQKLRHTCLFGIIVREDMRGRGIGALLIQELMEKAKNVFHIEILCLEVYEGNPAQRLYKKMGFTVFGVQNAFLLDAQGNYKQKICMQRPL